METDEKSLETALLYWINTFDTDDTTHAIRSMDKLCDGVVIYRILIDIDSLFFHSAIGATPTENGPSNWVLRLNNIKRLYKYLSRYYEERLNRYFPETNEYVPDLEAIAKNFSEKETIKFLKLVLACCFLSDQRKKYLKKVQNLDLQIQTVLEKTVHEIIELEKNETKNKENEKKILQTEDQMAILNKEKDILKKNYKVILEENIKLREDQQTMKSKLEIISKKLNGTENTFENYKYQIDSLQTQLNQSKQELNQYKNSMVEKNMEIEQKNIFITSLTHKNEELMEKTNEVIFLKKELQEEKNNIEELKNIMKKYKEIKSSHIPDQNKINNKNILHESTDKTCLLVNDKDVNNYKSELKSLEILYNQSTEEKKLLESQIIHLTNCLNIIKTDDRIDISDKNIQKLESYQEILNKSTENCSKYSSNQFRNQLNIHLESQVSEQGLNISKKESSEKSIVVIKNIIDNFKKTKNKTENKYLEDKKKYTLSSQITDKDEGNFSENSLFNSLYISSKKLSENPSNSEIQIHKSENSSNLEKNIIMESENQDDIYNLNSIDRINEHKELQTELEELKKNIKILENKNQYQAVLINSLYTEKDKLTQESINSKNVLSKLEEENNKLNSIIISISEDRDEEKKKQLEAQKKIEELQNELNQNITGTLKAKQLLKKQNTMIKELKEKALSGNINELYNELSLKNKQIEELKKTNVEEITRLKKENMLMSNAWCNLASHIKQNDPTTQYPLLPSDLTKANRNLK
ncbi:uncharacterized protein T551_02185 [Pneumocystis jirovecii RU7]|uniref:HOOK N-terminal domain-containing protein n=1 Tax=Pneumocystis jirovecii (strain RU7) TaxID=1408657 RepID=A0A0W4ZMG7_PNEJ7|nr:uncharacterized protein T551_02185 [Pneumocystis jirovecii RU7]KTW29569.1 hypothetical protein T551_02185 [Pneumocystis jirovecii RU7]